MESDLRLAGRITEWNDGRGYGFVLPQSGGDRAFVHISEFQPGSRRPMVGDLISYLPGKDTRGRLQAREIRHAGQRTKAPKPELKTRSTRLPRAAIGIAALAAVVTTTALGWLPVPLAGLYLLASCVSYLIYVFDKAAAARDDQRTPE